MAGDKKGKGKQVVQKKKRTREDREGEREQRQLQMQQTGRVRSGPGILRLRGSHSSSYIAQDVLRQLRPHLSPAHIHRLEVVVLTGQQAMTVRERQLVRTVMQRRSLHRLSCLISGVFQDLGSRG